MEGGLPKLGPRGEEYHLGGILFGGVQPLLSNPQFYIWTEFQGPSGSGVIFRQGFYLWPQKSKPRDDNGIYFPKRQPNLHLSFFCAVFRNCHIFPPLLGVRVHVFEPLFTHQTSVCGSLDTPNFDLEKNCWSVCPFAQTDHLPTAQTDHSNDANGWFAQLHGCLNSGSEGSSFLSCFLKK